MTLSIVVLPLVGFLFSCFLSFFKPSKIIDVTSQIITSGFIVLTAIFSFYIFIDNMVNPEIVRIKLFAWIYSGSLAIVFLISDLSSGITGSTIPVDAGYGIIAL